MTNLLKKSCFYSVMVWLSVVVFFSSGVYSETSRTIRLSIIHKSLILLLARNVVQAAYDKLGYQVEFKYLPPQRALELANIGTLDGETARIDGTDKIFTNLVKIPVPVSYITGVVFTRHIVRDIHTWNDLKGLKIGIIKGSP